MKARDGFAAVLFGASTLSTNYNGAKVTIQEKTAYPFSDEIEFSLTTSKPTEFTIYIRKPHWSKRVKTEALGAIITEREGYFLIQKKWKSGDKIRVNFKNEVQTVASNDEIAFRRGALIYALPIASQNETVFEYQVAGFTDFYVFPTDTAYKNYRLSNENSDNAFGFTFTNSATNDNPWYCGKTVLSGNFYNEKTKKVEPIRLIPMGSTVLRKVTFRSKP